MFNIPSVSGSRTKEQMARGKLRIICVIFLQCIPVNIKTHFNYFFHAVKHSILYGSHWLLNNVSVISRYQMSFHTILYRSKLRAIQQSKYFLFHEWMFVFCYVTSSRSQQFVACLWTKAGRRCARSHLKERYSFYFFFL